MTISIKAMYEHGVFRPTEPVDWEEGRPVEVSLRKVIEDSRRLTEDLIRIASPHLESRYVGFREADYDRVLYGGSPH